MFTTVGYVIFQRLSKEILLKYWLRALIFVVLIFQKFDYKLFTIFQICVPEIKFFILHVKCATEQEKHDKLYIIFIEQKKISGHPSKR